MSFRILRSRRRKLIAIGLVSVIVAGAVVGVVVGQRQPPGPSTTEAEVGGTVPLPEIFWTRGEPNLGQWKDSPWAQAYSELTRRLPAAFNARNYSDYRLRAVIDDTFLANTTLSSVASADYMIGPKPFVILDVIEDQGGESAKVIACEEWEEVWRVRKMPSDGTIAQSIGFVVQRSARLDETGEVKFETREDGLFDGQSSCELGQVTVGLFFPAPPFGSDMSETAIGPNGEVYDGSDIWATSSS